MNRQAKYVVHAFLIFLLICVTSFFLDYFAVLRSYKDEVTVMMIDTDQSIPALSAKAAIGRKLFLNNCASCHHLQKETVGPALSGFEQRGPWADREKLYAWIKNPPAFMAKDSYTALLLKKYKIKMSALPHLTKEEIDAICEYID